MDRILKAAGATVGKTAVALCVIFVAVAIDPRALTTACSIYPKIEAVDDGPL